MNLTQDLVLKTYRAMGIPLHYELVHRIIIEREGHRRTAQTIQRTCQGLVALGLLRNGSNPGSYVYVEKK